MTVETVTPELAELDARVRRALREARKIARDSTTARVYNDSIWIAAEMNSHLNGYQVRYSLPSVDGVFACRIPLFIDRDVFERYCELNDH